MYVKNFSTCTHSAALLISSAGPLIPAALGVSSEGATIVCAGINMYELLWGERAPRSVSNLTHTDELDVTGSTALLLTQQYYLLAGARY